MRDNRGITLLDPVIQEVNATVADPMRWFRLEEEMLLLGIGDKAASDVVFEAIDPSLAIEVRFLQASWRREKAR